MHFWGPYPYRSAFHATTEEEECERALPHLRDTIMFEGPDTIAAIILETVVGTNGILVPPPGYLAGVREICDEYGIVLIADEVMAGFGRCGEWFAVDHWGVTPDLITFAKGVNSGYVPLGGVVISDAIAETFRERAYPGGLTYSGHPLACASAVASIQIFKEEGIIEHARDARRGRDRPGAARSSPTATRASARCAGSACSGRSSWSATARPASRWCRTTRPVPAAAPMTELRRRLQAARAVAVHALQPDARRAAVHDHRARIREGLAILDEALDVADRYYTGS